LNAAKFVVTALAALLASVLFVSAVGGGVGSAVLERRRDRRAVVGMRESDGRYFFVDAVDVGGGGGITTGLFVSGEATVAELVDVGGLWDRLERGTRVPDLVRETLVLPVKLLLALFEDITLGPLSEVGRSTLLRRE
jgi:hypothetical protein